MMPVRTHPTPPPRELSKGEIKALFEHLKASCPEPTTELSYTNPYTLLIAVLLSAQTTDKGVNRISGALFEAADTPEKMIAMGEEVLRSHIATLGLYRTKAKNIIALSRMLIQEHNSQVPDKREALERLPGVGRKTANVILNVLFKQSVFPVDTHVFRVANRTGLAVGKNTSQVEQALEQSVPKEYGLHAHHWLVLHGRYVCTAVNPRCTQCEISHICLFSGKTTKGGR